VDLVGQEDLNANHLKSQDSSLTCWEAHDACLWGLIVQVLETPCAGDAAGRRRLKSTPEAEAAA